MSLTAEVTQRYTLLYSSLLLLIFNRCLELMVLLAGGDRTTYYDGRSHIYSRR
ncbi:MULTISPECIES: hypothetical protein [Kamptonema]|uniref:hypothetical protein n=1 Tax=Kamptonema TaxID=1501433 RepID=UPI0012D771FD|nr:MULTISPECIES: hypothetical protein [Kamptonema]